MSSLRKDKQLALNLKGLSILAVIGLHLLTLISPQNFLELPRNFFFITLNQFLRFCVPVFIFLSGFGLSLKYNQTKFNLVEFYKCRLIKLLPLYLLWSAYYLFLSEFITPWWKVLQTGPIWKILLLGWSDYHLYFVSVIFQLYLLFPLILKLSKSFLKPMLFLSLVTQLSLYALFSFSSSPPSDQIQNTIFLSWIFYFIFGVFLSQKKTFISFKLSLILTLIGLTLSSFDTYQYLNQTQNIVLAIRFAKLPQILYSFGFINLFLTLPKKSFNNQFLSWLGKNSYLIYLSHPVLIHLAKFDLSTIPLIPVLLSFSCLSLISLIKTPHKGALLLARKP